MARKNKHEVANSDGFKALVDANPFGLGIVRIADTGHIHLITKGFYLPVVRRISDGEAWVSKYCKHDGIPCTYEGFHVFQLLAVSVWTNCRDTWRGAREHFADVSWQLNNPKEAAERKVRWAAEEAAAEKLAAERKVRWAAEEAAAEVDRALLARLMPARRAAVDKRDAVWRAAVDKRDAEWRAEEAAAETRKREAELQAKYVNS